MTTGGREFQVAGAAQLKDRLSISVRLKGQNPLHQFPRNKSVTRWQLPRLRGS